MTDFGANAIGGLRNEYTARTYSGRSQSYECFSHRHGARRCQVQFKSGLCRTSYLMISLISVSDRITKLSKNQASEEMWLVPDQCPGKARNKKGKETKMEACARYSKRVRRYSKQNWEETWPRSSTSSANAEGELIQLKTTLPGGFGSLIERFAEELNPPTAIGALNPFRPPQAELVLVGICRWATWNCRFARNLCIETYNYYNVKSWNLV